jgi:hypothetical protein
MITRVPAVALAALLAACSTSAPPPPMSSYDMSAAVVRADANGWYTFGDTRFKGAVIDGAPDGDGLCIVKGVGTQAAACSFVRGQRSDVAYVEGLRSALTRETAAKIATEQMDRADREAGERQRTREHNAAVSANDLAMRSTFTNLNRTLDAAAAQSHAVSSQTRRLTDDALREKQLAADAEAERKRMMRAEQQAREKAATRESVERTPAAAARARGSAETASRAADEQRKRQRGDQGDAEKQTQTKIREIQRAQEKADGLRREKAEKEAEASAKLAYLRQMESGIKLKARTCPDGEGKFYVVGRRPSIKPKAVSCIDVQYEAICSGSNTGSKGVATNFLGVATDCFMGDTAAISPKPACKVGEVRVEVRKVNGCAR